MGYIYKFLGEIKVVNNKKTRWTLQERWDNYPNTDGWWLSSKLFYDETYDGMLDIHAFEICNYNNLLDNAKSLQDIIDGLRELSPLADDALEVVESMNDNDFYNFKLALAYERRSAELDDESKMPRRYNPLLIPERFLSAGYLTKEFDVTLGVALIRIMEEEENHL